MEVGFTVLVELLEHQHGVERRAIELDDEPAEFILDRDGDLVVQLALIGYRVAVGQFASNQLGFRRGCFLFLLSDGDRDGIVLALRGRHLENWFVAVGFLGDDPRARCRKQQPKAKGG